ncbi:uncharacterized protein LOC116351578, partial [Contarinia nasturtii]|uniref:uncharacterized protein LOC116351578 n=1 Tax=Contarinia nasturtii TaxID=265458 RepID=UPI0012D39C02
MNKINERIKNARVNSALEMESSFENEEDRPSVSHHLREWALKYNVRHNSLGDLLKILIRHGLKFLPKDPRTLLKTPQSILIEPVASGSFWYAGIENKLRKLFHSPDKNVGLELNIHVDGLQIYNSSSKQFWPILIQIHGLSNIEPFAAAVWYGEGKPSCVNEYLSKFVEEINNLTLNGMEIKGYFFSIKVRCIIADTPARVFLKGVRNFNHHAGCQRCITRGKSIRNTMSFPILNSPLRTDADFRSRSDPAHHLKYSVIEEILNFDLIFDMPLSDPLHLLDIGVMKHDLLRAANENKPTEINRPVGTI